MRVLRGRNGAELRPTFPELRREGLFRIGGKRCARSGVHRGTDHSFKQGIFSEPTTLSYPNGFQRRKDQH